MNLDDIKRDSQKKLDELVNELKKTYSEISLPCENVCIYVCGSLGRLEMTHNSDLDLFFITMNDKEQQKDPIRSNLNKYVFFSDLYKINKNLEYQEPSKQGEYWDFISKEKLLDIGSREEDFNNSFTARMLLILESKPIYNENAYKQLIKEIIDDKYFKDYKDHSGEFYPLFLMNDISRYWYTLTLNYEYRRDNNDNENKKNWKRLKLKFARLITCFSMLACLYKKNITPEHVINCIEMTPFERLRMHSSESDEIRKIVEYIEEEYAWFLSLKKEGPEWWEKGANKSDALSRAEKFHETVVHKLMRVISETNPELRNKTDVY